MFLDGSNVNILIALLAGALTFFASCLLPLVPTYIAYLSGVSKHPNDKKKQKKEVFVNSIFFTLGFTLIFVLLGFTASSLGLALRSHRKSFQQFGGAFLIFVGLFMLGLFKSKFLQKERRINFHHEIIKKRKLKSILFGATFGFAWSPCIGPILSVILFWASQAQTMLKGVILLISYGVGLGIPFIIVGLLFEKIAPLLKFGGKISKIINIAAAAIIILTGLTLLFGDFGYFSKLIGLHPHGM